MKLFKRGNSHSLLYAPKEEEMRKQMTKQNHLFNMKIGLA